MVLDETFWKTCMAIRTLLCHLCQLQNTNSDDAVFPGEAVVLDLEHQLVVLRLALVAQEAKYIRVWKLCQC